MDQPRIDTAAEIFGLPAGPLQPAEVLRVVRGTVISRRAPGCLMARAAATPESDSRRAREHAARWQCAWRRHSLGTAGDGARTRFAFRGGDRRPSRRRQIILTIAGSGQLRTR